MSEMLMKRDMDMIRELLLKIEGGQGVFYPIPTETAQMFGHQEAPPLTNDEANKLRLHLDMLEEIGFIRTQDVIAGGAVFVERITWPGYEYLESVRDPETWRKTKEGANAVKNWSIETIKEIGKGLIRKQIEDYTGVKLG